MLIANTPLASYRIILPAAALEGERDVADLLSEVIACATGVTLPVATDDTPATDCEIVIGKTNRDTDKVATARAETPTDLAEIRDELYRSGYASRMKGYAAPKKQPAPAVLKFRTTGGYMVYCGKNNLQNEYITHKLADRGDYWFHAKGVPGSHVVMVTNGEEPDAQDFTDAASIAAHYSKAAGGVQVPVDYLLVRHVRKVAGAKPGFVVYHTNWTAYVTPDAERVASMRIK